MARRRFYKSELTISCDSTNKSKNYLGVLISIMVLILISSLIVVAIVTVNPEIVNLPDRPAQHREPITLEEAILNELSPAGFAFRWLTDATYSGPASGETATLSDMLLFEESKNINAVTLPPDARPPFKPEVHTLVANTSVVSYIDYEGFTLSPSKRYLLVWTNKVKQFRHTFTARYFLYDIKLDAISLLSTREDAAPTTNRYAQLDLAAQYLNERDDDDDARTRFQLVDWLQLPAKGDALVMVQSNDVYLIDDVGPQPSGESGGGPRVKAPTRLTFTGEPNKVFNAVPDWLYEEEILADVPAYQVSPGASSLAYMSFNDSAVDSMPFSIYGPSDQVIPRTKRIKYPKTGRVNPTVTVRVVDALGSPAAARRDVLVELPPDLIAQQHYISRINWLTDDHLALSWLNRDQNVSHLLVCSRAADWACAKNLHTQSPGGWLEPSDDVVALPDGRSYLALVYKPEGADVGAFKHVARVALDKSDSYVFLTSGRREVLSVLAVDTKRKIFFYLATPANEPGQRQVYFAPLDPADAANMALESDCLTCDHYPTECLYNVAKMSPSGDFYVFECGGPGVPRVELRSTTIQLRKLADIRLAAAQRSPTSVATAAAQTAAVVNVIERANTAKGKLDASNPSLISSRARAYEELDESSTRKEDERRGPKAIRSLGATDASLLWILEDNRALRDKLALRKAMPLMMRLKVPIANTNYLAQVLLLLPPQLSSHTWTRTATGRPRRSPAFPSFQSSPQSQVGGRPKRLADLPLHSHLTAETAELYAEQLPPGQQYPMVVDVYGGPGSQKVDYRFHINLGHHLASSGRAIYAMIDGRGSGFQGTKRLYELYHKFGTVEIDDQIYTAAHLTRSLAFVDANKVAIWGWSYGGYAAAMALARSNSLAWRSSRFNAAAAAANNNNNNNNTSAAANSQSLSFLAGNNVKNMNNNRVMNGVFECAVSVAPVTNWIYYDTAYTERYMSSPYENAQYDDRELDDHCKNPAGVSSNRLDNNRPADSSPTHSRTNEWLTLARNDHNNNNNYYNISKSANSDFQLNIARVVGLSRDLSGNSTRSPPGDRQCELNDRYKRASLIEHIGDIDRRRFLLIHGTADDNVHFQQSIMLMKKLIQLNVLFESRLYPDQDHAIANKEDKLHLGYTLSNFFSECFDMA